MQKRPIPRFEDAHANIGNARELLKQRMPMFTVRNKQGHIGVYSIYYEIMWVVADGDVREVWDDDAFNLDYMEEEYTLFKEDGPTPWDCPAVYARCLAYLQKHGAAV